MIPYIEEVQPGELRRAMSAYNAAGVDVRGYRRLETGMMAIVIMLPSGDSAPDWRSAPRRAGFHPPAFNWRVFVQLLCVFAIIGGIGYLAWTLFAPQPTLAGVPVEVGGMKIGPDGRMVQPTAWEQAQTALDDAADWLRGLLPKQAPAAQPQTAPAPWWRFWDTQPDTVQPQADDSSEWTWPPKNPVGDAIDGTMQIVTWLTYAVIILGLLWLVSFILGIVGKFRR